MPQWMLYLMFYSRRPFPLLLRQYGEFIDDVSDQIVNYHNQLIVTVILQDAQSHDWTDWRAFYEVNLACSLRNVMRRDVRDVTCVT